MIRREKMFKIYVIPFMADFVNFLVLLWVSDAAGREMRLGDGRPLSDGHAAWLVGIFSACYLLSCLPAGRMLSRANAKPILVVSTVLMMLFGVPLFFACHYAPP